MDLGTAFGVALQDAKGFVILHKVEGLGGKEAGGDDDAPAALHVELNVFTEFGAAENDALGVLQNHVRKEHLPAGKDEPGLGIENAHADAHIMIYVIEGAANA